MDRGNKNGSPSLIYCNRTTGQILFCELWLGARKVPVGTGVALVECVQRPSEISLPPGGSGLEYHQRELRREMPARFSPCPDESHRLMNCSLVGAMRLSCRGAVPGEKRTYAELHADAIFWSFCSGPEGVEAGDRVLLWGERTRRNGLAAFGRLSCAARLRFRWTRARTRNLWEKEPGRDAGVKLILQDRRLPALGPEFRR